MESDSSEDPPELVNRDQILKNWEPFDLPPELKEQLVVNNFVAPTEVQTKSLVYLKSRADMIIAAKTGQGKTLCFGLPILDLLTRKLNKMDLKEDELEGVKALIMSPTRELAIQIKDMLSQIVPERLKKKIKLCALVGGMSIQKQERWLSYEPAIVIATPGRLWEFIDERQNEYLIRTLPLIDVLVLDEADRMIEDGHFKEMRQILQFIYDDRVAKKKELVEGGKKKQKERSGSLDEKSEKVKAKEKIIQEQKQKGTKNQFTLKSLEAKKGVDLSNVQDLFSEEQMLNELDPTSLIIDEDDLHKASRSKSNPKKKKSKQEEEKFALEYQKLGGIQHIICSATLTIDGQGRLTPKKLKKKQDAKLQPTIEQLGKVLRFRSKQPQIIDLTSEDQKMPEKLKELAVRCKVEEKDLYLYYFLKQNQGTSFIVFSNSITCTKRLVNLLNFMKIKSFCLHSKMQQRQRLKNLDRFKLGVKACEKQEGEKPQSAILVCTDVAARGLDIPNVANVVHYQSPYNAEIYVHRCGRTARINKSGQSLAILGPEDEKGFKIISKVLQKQAGQVEMFKVSYTALAKLEPLIDTAKKFEAAMHQKQKGEKQAIGLLKMAKAADLNIDEDLQKEIMAKSGKKVLDMDDLDDFKLDGEGAKHKKKQADKLQELRKKYESMKSGEQYKAVNNSTFLTPEAASYLNKLVKSGEHDVDKEVVYAGQHSEFKKQTKFKRKERYPGRYKNRTKKRKRKN